MGYDSKKFTTLFGWFILFLYYIILFFYLNIDYFVLVNGKEEHKFSNFMTLQSKDEE